MTINGAVVVDGWRAVGRVTALYRHPIKSMAAQSVTRARVDRYGIAGDRRFALRRRRDRSGFPWLSAGKLPALIRYEVCCSSAEEPTRAAMHVHAPSGDFFSCEGDELSSHFADVHGVAVELAHLKQGIFDLAGLSLITTQTLASIASMLPMPMTARRFRPNVVINVDSGGGEFPEDAWVGATLAFGDLSSGPRMSVTERDERCAMINLDPDTGGSEPVVLRTVVRERNNYAGVYGVPTRVGEIGVGDLVFAHVA